MRRFILSFLLLVIGAAPSFAAYNEFYMQTTGSDLNAGSTNADTASLTYASGNYVNATGVFTVASGNPSTDGVAVGDWVSVYANGDTATPFVAKVTARDATTITVSATDRFGTNPTDGTGNRSLKVGGAWASLALCATGRLFAVTTVNTIPIRINIKAGTYANTTNSRAVSLNGNVTNPVWVRGYKTTIGDLDDIPTTTLVNATDLPLITFTNGTFNCSVTANACQIFSSLSFQRLSSGTNGAVTSFAGQQNSALFIRCRFENQVVGAASYASVVSNGTVGSYTYLMCWFKATSTATRVISHDASAHLAVYGCVLEGGGDGIYGIRTSHIIKGNLFKAVGGNGIYYTNSGARGLVENNSFYNCGSDGVEISVSITNSPLILITNNIFEGCLYGIKNSSGSPTGVWLARNSFYSMTSGDLDGLGELTDLWKITESASHFTDAAGGDFSLKSTSVAKGVALPQLFENNNNKSWGDVGAVQREEPAGSSSPSSSVGFSN